MQKLTKKELKEIKAGTGGGCPIICNFTSTTCGDMCLNICTDDVHPPVSSCSAYLVYLNPNCHFVAHTVTQCPIS